MRKTTRIWSLLLVALAWFGGGPSAASAQRSQQPDSRSLRSIEAIQRLREAGQYEQAEEQALAVLRSAEELRDTLLSAIALREEALNILARPGDATQKNVEAARILRRSIFLLQRLGRDSLIERNLELLWQLAGRRGPSPVTRKSSRNQKIDPSVVDSQSLTALVLTQQAAIDALTDRQMRQLLLLNEQERRLDSMAINRLGDSIQLMQQDYILQQQQTEIYQRRYQRYFFLFIFFLLATAVMAFGWRYYSARKYQAQLEEKNQAIEYEKRRSDELLLNLLPAPVAEELKEKGYATARKYDSATVLFTDFQDFSSLSRELSAEELLRQLDQVFSAFDAITDRYGLEKIKTMGDAYLCVAGLPEPVQDHVYRAVAAALEIQEWLAEHSTFQARIGIHCGPLVAGVLGSRKFAYDIWGDTVNVAARLESAGEVGRVNVSQTVCHALNGRFSCEYRGKLPVKNLGEMEMYFVNAVDGGR